MEGTEEWRPVAACEGMYAKDYEVSSFGKVRKILRGENGEVVGRKLRKLTPRKDGYVAAGLRAGRRTHRFLVHRLVLGAFAGPCKEGFVCCHNNGVRDDNRIENLRWGTYQSNAEDRYKHAKEKGEMPQQRAKVKLTARDVVIIRRDPRDDEWIATQFMISKQRVRNIRSRKSRTDVPEDAYPELQSTRDRFKHLSEAEKRALNIDEPSPFRRPRSASAKQELLQHLERLGC